MHVHEAVIKAGAKISGCTVHFVDEGLDTGPIITQTAVPVLADDTPKTLAARVLEAEHRAYPEAAKLFCEERLKVSGRVVRILPPKGGPAHRKKRALVSVSDKTGLVDFCKALARMDVEIVSTSGTAKALMDAGISVRSLESLTGFPEILGGRVKTLHPKVHGGILMRRKNADDQRDAAALGLEPIDLVVVNLYPFAKTAAGARDPFSQDVIEQIDIGGVTLIRAAAKNYEDVAILVSSDDYSGVLKEMQRSSGEISWKRADVLRPLRFAIPRITTPRSATLGAKMEPRLRRFTPALRSRAPIPTLRDKASIPKHRNSSRIFWRSSFRRPKTSAMEKTRISRPRCTSARPPMEKRASSRFTARSFPTIISWTHRARGRRFATSRIQPL
jgi:hypothetical protein